MKTILLISLLVFSLSNKGNCQPGNGMFLIRVFSEEKNLILFTPADNNRVKVYYTGSRNTKAYSDTNSSRKTFGYTGFAGGYVKKIVIRYNHQKMTIRLLKNCPTGFNGTMVEIDTIYFKQGKYFLDCSKSSDQYIFTDEDIMPYYWRKNKEDE